MLSLVAFWNMMSSFCTFSCDMGYVIFVSCVGFCLYCLMRMLESSSKLMGVMV